MNRQSGSPNPRAERARALLAEHDLMAKPSWARLGRKYGIPGGTLSRIAHSGGAFFPAMWAARLGVKLTVLIPAPACPKCGQVHVTKRCPHAEKKARVTWRSRMGEDLLARLEYLDRAEAT